MKTSSLLTHIRAHFDAHRQREKYSFFWRVTLEGLLVPVLVLVLMKVIWRLQTRTDLDSMTSTQLAVYLLVFAPFFETLLLHALPVHVARRFGLKFWWQVLVALGLFAAGHFPSGMATGVAAGVISGFYFSFTYVHWRTHSFRSAFWMTSASHAVHNLVIFVIVIIAGR